MDDNDLYNAIVDKDPYAGVRVLTDELEAGAHVLTESEREYLTGVIGSMGLFAPLSPQVVQTLRALVLQLRQRLHAYR